MLFIISYRSHMYFVLDVLYLFIILKLCTLLEFHVIRIFMYFERYLSMSFYLVAVWDS